MNLPNKLTIARILLTFVFMFFLFPHGFSAKIVAFFIFTAAALTDLYDGRIARSRNLVTDFGRLMDPIADKILVLAAFLAFVELKIIPAWMVMVIIARESLITGLRLLVANKNIIIAASGSGKHKTVSQMAVIFLILIFIVLKETMLTFFTWSPGWEQFFHQGIYLLMLFTVGLTLYSGAYYLWDNRKVITKL